MLEKFYTTLHIFLKCSGSLFFKWHIEAVRWYFWWFAKIRKPSSDLCSDTKGKSEILEWHDEHDRDVSHLLTLKLQFFFVLHFFHGLTDI